MSSTRLPPRFTFGATRFHFQSERHSVSMSTPPRRNGPLRQGMNCLSVSARTSGSSTGLPATRMPSSMRHPVSVWGRESIAAFHFGMSPWRPGLSASLHWRSRYAAGSGSKKEKIWDMGWLVIWLFGYLVIWLFGYLVGWLTGWVVGSLVRWFVGSLVRWFVGWLVRWLVGWLFGWLVGWLFRWFVGWLVRWFVGSLVRWFVGSLVRCFVGSL